ncbi:MAG: hypothetical protein LH606_05900 [Cytophagaceae bacterium]|nr:hypothetical protein [Cytophagaceae bacterium]
MELIIKVQDEKAPFLLELLENFSFVEIEKPSATDEEPTKEQILADLKQSLIELRNGTLKTRPLKELLDEL